MKGANVFSLPGTKIKLTEISKLKQRIEELERTVQDREQTIQSLQRQIAQYRDFSNATFSVDFRAMNAFSVERLLSESMVPTTVIGYMLAEPVTVKDEGTVTKDVVREWTLRCSAEQHERLVEEFNEYVQSKS